MLNEKIQQYSGLKHWNIPISPGVWLEHTRGNWNWLRWDLVSMVLLQHRFLWSDVIQAQSYKKPREYSFVLEAW